MKTTKVCAFFGHSTIYENISDILEASICLAIEKHGVTEFWCGGYGEFDAIAAAAAHRVKREYPEVKIILVRAYLPKRGDKLDEVYDDSIYPEGLETVPRRFAISHRNRWMAKNCDMAIMYVKHTYGGAYQALSAVRRRTIPVWNIGEEKCVELYRMR